MDESVGRILTATIPLLLMNCNPKLQANLLPAQIYTVNEVNK